MRLIFINRCAGDDRALIQSSTFPESLSSERCCASSDHQLSKTIFLTTKKPPIFKFTNAMLPQTNNFLSPKLPSIGPYYTHAIDIFERQASDLYFSFLLDLRTTKEDKIEDRSTPLCYQQMCGHMSALYASSVVLQNSLHLHPLVTDTKKRPNAKIHLLAKPQCRGTNSTFICLENCITYDMEWSQLQLNSPATSKFLLHYTFGMFHIHAKQ